MGFCSARCRNPRRSSFCVQDDEFMRKTFGAVYDCLPKPVCRFIGEERFIAFCLEHRRRLVAPNDAAECGVAEPEMGKDLK